MLQSELTSVREEFRTAIAPVEYAAGWNVLAAIGLATSVLLADVFAFRADARAETLVPGGVLFVFVGALGDERLRIVSAVLLVGVGVVATVGLRWYHAEPDRRPGGTSVRRWPVALAFGVTIAVAAGFAGPRLPGADAAPLYETSGGGGNVTQVISPLVDIQSRLTNQSTAELFRDPRRNRVVLAVVGTARIRRKHLGAPRTRSATPRRTRSSVRPFHGPTTSSASPSDSSGAG